MEPSYLRLRFHGAIPERLAAETFGSKPPRGALRKTHPIFRRFSGGLGEAAPRKMATPAWQHKGNASRVGRSDRSSDKEQTPTRERLAADDAFGISQSPRGSRRSGFRSSEARRRSVLGFAQTLVTTGPRKIGHLASALSPRRSMEGFRTNHAPNQSSDWMRTISERWQTRDFGHGDASGVDVEGTQLSTTPESLVVHEGTSRGTCEPPRSRVDFGPTCSERSRRFCSDLKAIGRRELRFEATTATGLSFG